MNPFFEYISRQLAEKLMKRRVVVWYDSRSEFTGFVRALRGGAEIDACALEEVKVGELKAHLCCFTGSQFELKFAVDPVMASDDPEPLLVYLSGVAREDETTNTLMELDRAGVGFDWKMGQLAHLCLREHFPLDRVDQILSGDIAYEDIAEILKDSGESDGSILASILPDARFDAQRLGAWLAMPEQDEVNTAKGARGEIERLIGKVGCMTDEKASLAELRLRAARHVLVGEFVLDLKSDAPQSVALVNPPKNAEQEKLLRQTTHALRESHGDPYVKLADQVEQEFQLAAANIPAEKLGSIDTFRFEEKALLEYAGSLIVERKFNEARKLVSEHARSFWADREQRRQQQWEACRRMAALGAAVEEVRASLPKPGATVGKWIEGYTQSDGWYRADMLYRQLESHLASMADVPDSEVAHTTVIAEYEELLRVMCDWFVAAQREASWQFSKGTLRQTQVFEEFVGKPAKSGGPTALILGDSLRFEMGVELSRQFDDAKEMVLKAAVAAIPTITPIGMAALLPGAAASFDVADSGGKVGGRIGGKVLATLKDRMTLLKASVPGAKDMELDDLLAMNASQLKKRLEGATLLVVRAQDIDQLGEAGKGNLARQVMDTAVSNIGRGIRKLAQNGISRFVVVADHGHVFGKNKDESMRIDAPGGGTADLHRRCWIGRGGVTPPGTVRLAGSELGYDTDLDFVFPMGTGVFKAGGDLGYHHGGMSLQELIVPVLVIELPTHQKLPSSGLTIELKDAPQKVTNRTFRISVSVAGSLFGKSKVVLRPSLATKDLQVGEAAMALDGEFDPTTKCVSVEPGKTAAIMMLVQRDDVKSLRVLIEDASSGASLYQSPAEIPVDLM